MWGWKALARGLSDIAAMGGQPRFCLLSLAVADWVDARWLDRFYGGLLALGRARRGGVDRRRSGADGARDVRHRGGWRSAARAGAAAGWGARRRRDLCFGALGGSALGLAAGRGKAWVRHRRPQPRLALGRFLRARLGATAAMDLSDGLPWISTVCAPHRASARRSRRRRCIAGQPSNKRCTAGRLRIAVHGAAACPRAGGIRGAGTDPHWYHAPGRRGHRGDGRRAAPAAWLRPPAPLLQVSLQSGARPSGSGEIGIRLP